MAAIAGVIAWHLATVAQRRRWPDAAAYAASRLLLLAFFGSSAVVLRRQHVDMHLHHLYLGWSLALFAELDHWLSAVTLAVGSGIFLQGVGAYSFAPIFQVGSHWVVKQPAAVGSGNCRVLLAPGSGGGVATVESRLPRCGAVEAGGGHAAGWLPWSNRWPDPNLL
jgi:hypothetical protein